MDTISTVLGWIFAALFGGAGIVGLLMIRPKKNIEKKLIQEEEDRKRLDRVDDIERIVYAINEEQTVQCYCILACLKGLSEQGCDGPVHEGIQRMEQHLNAKAHALNK